MKPSDSSKAKADLQKCKQAELSVESYASKFRGLANGIIVGEPVDKTTQASWFLVTSGYACAR